MCGIVGMVNLNAWSSPARQKWFETALLVDQIRGDHSTGVAVMPKFDIGGQSPKPKMYKAALGSSDYLLQPKARKILSLTDDAACVLGHNRYATQGDIDDKSAHPFLTDKIALVHNGTLDNRDGLDYDHAIDSAAIALQLHHTDVKDYTTVLSKLEGAFTLVWFNMENDTVYITRNDERPLYISYGTGKKSMFFASEDWMLNSLMERKEGVILDGPPIKLETGILYSKSFNPDVSDDLVLDELKYTQRPTWSGTWNSAYDMYSDYDNYPHLRGSDKTVSYLPKKADTTTAPIKKGEEIFIDNWDWKVYKTNKEMGSIIGVASDHVGVGVIIPNVSMDDWNATIDLWNESINACGDDAFTALAGTVSSIDPMKGKGEWIVTIPYSTIILDDVKFETLKDEEEEKK